LQFIGAIMTAVKSKSVLRKFSIIFVGVALIPFIILFYLHSLYDESHSFIQILDVHFSLILVIIGVISILGFFGMRLTIKKIILLTETISVIDKIDEKTMLELAKEEGEIGELAKSFIHTLKRVNIKEQQTKETKEMIYDVLKKASEVLAVVNNYDNLIRLVLETGVDALGANQGALFSAADGRYVLKAWVGNDNVTPEQVMDAAQVYLDQMTRENKFFLIPAKEKSERLDTLLIPPLVFSPLIHNEKFLGVLCFCGNSYWNKSSNDHIQVVLNLSHQLAVSFENAKINKNTDQTLFETLAALALAVEARDPYSRGHLSRVGKDAQKIGELMGLPEEDIKTLRDASMLHDIGKIGIRYGVLIKQGQLSAEEKYVIKNHPVIGESIVLHLKEYKHLLDPIRHHHELLDGSGYPDGLKNGEISRITSILAVADLFDTLLENRSYRSGMDFKDAKKELDYLIKAGKIDKDVVSSLYHMIDNVA
jgi:response regulator RpfG family c-di-GMP phosphodiesterase